MTFTRLRRRPRRKAQSRESRVAPPARAAYIGTHSHYLIVGLLLAGLWLLNRDRSLLFHAVQMLGLMSVLTALQIVLLRRAHEATPYVRLISAKLVLVALAVGGEWLIAPATSRSNAIVAVGLVVLVTALGPVLDRVAAKRAMRAAGPTGPGSQLAKAGSTRKD
jgi:Na+-translocating ferredoxin:NAD+ oxidoreductase RnfD subunit